MRAVACLILVLSPFAGYADTPVPPANCQPPERPAADAPETVWMAYTAGIEVFRVCISTYVERNNAASDAHRAAANQGTLIWNEFVRTSLNSPRSFPAPRPEREAEGAASMAPKTVAPSMPASNLAQ